MSKSNFLKLSLYSFLIGIFIFMISYFFFHFVTDEGITLEWQAEAGKPFVANLIAIFGVLFIFMSVASLLISIIFFDENR